MYSYGISKLKKSQNTNNVYNMLPTQPIFLSCGRSDLSPLRGNHLCISVYSEIHQVEKYIRPLLLTEAPGRGKKKGNPDNWTSE